MASEKSSNAKTGHKFQRSGFSYEQLIRFFFASNAGLSIVILTLIIAFLLKEGLGFFPGYRRDLETYRIAGLEFVDISRNNLTAHEQLTSLLNRAYYAEVNGKSSRELKRTEEASALYNAFTDQVGPTRDLILNNPQAETDGNAGMKAALLNNYEKQREKALQKPLSTPHLTNEERQQLIESLRARPPEATDDPPLVAALAQEFVAAQQKHAAPLQEFRTVIDDFESAGFDLGSIVMEMTESVTVTKEQLQTADILEKDRKTLLAAASGEKDPVERERLLADAHAALADKPDVETPMQALLERKPECVRLHEELKTASSAAFDKIPQSLTESDAKRILSAARKAWPVFITDLDMAPGKINAWKHTDPVPLSDAFMSFLTGKKWVTGGEWQDFYGILPLAIGSLMIAMIALSIAIPVSISAAIYVNHFAKPREQALVKPIIEFIQAIPSVVLGFVGILVFGTILREISVMDAFQWVPGFPIEERLNIFTAGCLLALMSIPTIFSLAEDALNNVPSAYAEASEALGASHVQTAFRVMIPASFSGILAAILLGFGRVIGETMVVLLVAGNRIKIPDFSEGLGAFFQPSHTLTGIIAQELGEVPLGSVHYRALFVVGIVLFAVVLGINATAHHFVNRAKK
ncbi:MAG: phosphate ABC transporter permease subunit PstC [Akkermansiaceae bacterium]|jgi:phosphate transport system permease protein|nr:phosphate ABC transporter permease subunit PstC [Luteolibacter sp.]